MEKVKLFTPTEFFNPNTEQWEDIKFFKGDWIKKDDLVKLMKNIVQLTDDLILVIWLKEDEGGQNTQTIYKGILELN